MNVINKHVYHKHCLQEKNVKGIELKVRQKIREGRENGLGQIKKKDIKESSNLI